MRNVRFIIAVVLALALLTSCGTTSNPSERSVFAMDTCITIQAYGRYAKAALDDVENQIYTMDEQWSVTDEGSEIYAANHSGGKPVSIGADTSQLINFALTMARNTDGALDPTIYPVLMAWGFTTEEYHVPSQEELNGLLPLVDYKKISLTDTTLAVPNGMQLDLGAVAKGYAGDKAVDILRNHGVTSALVNLGGNVQTIGAKPDGSLWRIGVRNPFTDSNLGVLEIKDVAVVTSGGYERYFTDSEGNVYWHILDPDTGCPADSGLASVTVVAPEGKMCDALSTALFVMGTEKAVDFWHNSQNFEMLLVTIDGGIYLTEGLENAFTLSDDAGPMEVTVLSR